MFATTARCPENSWSRGVNLNRKKYMRGLDGDDNNRKTRARFQIVPRTKRNIRMWSTILCPQSLKTCVILSDVFLLSI